MKGGFNDFYIFRSEYPRNVYKSQNVEVFGGNFSLFVLEVFLKHLLM